jgi:virulence factor
MKIGIVGLGDIALKAYLPVIGKRELEVHLCTRDAEKLETVAKQYRFDHRHGSVDSLISAGVQAAFVHTSTSSHYEIVRRLLENNIHVYVDKPVTYDYSSTEALIDLANKRKVTLMCGFNRRYAPAYAALREMEEVNMIIMQKNRRHLAEEVRRFVFDDFIHVIDTLLFLAPHTAERVSVTGKKYKRQLAHLVVEIISARGPTCIGVMNRDSGTTEERLEVFSPNEKRVVSELTDTLIFTGSQEIEQKNDNWESTLYKRGFEQITQHFLDIVSGRAAPTGLHKAILRTHQICEEVVRQLS